MKIVTYLLICIVCLNTVLVGCVQKKNTQAIDKNKIQLEINKPKDEMTVLSKYKKDIIDQNGILDEQVNNIPITDMREYLSLYTDEELSSVIELELSNNEITTISGLERLPNLKRLFLGLNKITNVISIELPNKLETLWLSKNPIKGTFYITKNMSAIIHLAVADSLISKVEGIENLPKNLVNIDFLQNPIENPEEFLKLNNIKSVLQFSMSNKISETRIREIQNQIRVQNPNTPYLRVIPYVEGEAGEMITDDGM